jgi:hypothetical protein
MACGLPEFADDVDPGLETLLGIILVIVFEELVSTLC